jgi:hypothetical protein
MSQNGWRVGTEFEANKWMKTVRIHATFDGRVFVLPSGEPIPALKPGTEVEIRVLATEIADEEVAKRLATIRKIEVLPAGTRLIAIIKGLPDRNSPQFEEVEQDMPYLSGLLKHVRGYRFADDSEPNNPDGAVEVLLHEPLRVVHQGDKPPKLDHCRCEISYFASRQNPLDPVASSLNHAFTRISEIFETGRISHTGNAFTRFFVINDHLHQLRRLDKIVARAVQAHSQGSAKPIKTLK